MKRSLREIIVPVLLAAAIGTGIVGAAVANRSNNETQLTISCQSARNNIDQLTALREIADQLGVPVDFTIPEEPAECDGH